MSPLSCPHPKEAAPAPPRHGFGGPLSPGRVAAAASSGDGGWGGFGVGLPLPPSPAASPEGPPAPLLRTACSVHRGAVSHERGLAGGPGLPARGGDGAGGR